MIQEDPQKQATELEDDALQRAWLKQRRGIEPDEQDVDDLQTAHLVRRGKTSESLLDKLTRGLEEGWKKGVRGPAEGIASVGTGTAGFLAGFGGGIANIVSQITIPQMIKSRGKVDWEEAQNVAREIREAVSTVGGLYHPTTKTGQAIAWGAGQLYEKPKGVWTKGAEAITDDPQALAALDFLGDAIIGWLLGKGLKGAAGIVKAKSAKGQPVKVREIKEMARSKPEVVEALKELPDEMPVTPKVGSKKIVEWEKGQLERAELGVGKKGYELTLEETTALGLDKPRPLSEAAGEAIVSELSQAMRELKPLRQEQEMIYTKERGKRITRFKEAQKEGGRAGFLKAKKELGGVYRKVETDVYESIAPKFTPEKIDYLVDRVRDSSVLDVWETLDANTALMKIFGEETIKPEVVKNIKTSIKVLKKQIEKATDLKVIERHEKSIDVLTDRLAQQTKIPQARELELLSREFGEEFAHSVAGNWNAWTRFKKKALDVANVPRSLMASFDLSAPLRQGLFLIGRGKFYSSFAKMFQYFGSEKAVQALKQSIVEHPNYEYAKGRLSLTEMGKELGKREERFQSQMAERIPLGIGVGVKASGRAYAGFLNKLRFDVFNDLLTKAEKVGANPKSNVKLLDDIANYVNAATGRGKLPKGLEGSAVALNAIFFSPRLAASRLTLLNPMYYTKVKAFGGGTHKFVRQQAMKDLLTLTGAGMTVLQLAKLAGAEVGTDPSSTRFGKITIGDTQIDIWGGFQQYAVLAGRILLQEVTSSVTGKTKKLGEGYKPETLWSLVGRSARYKLSPPASFIYDFFAGRDEKGDPFNLPTETIERLVPMVIQDLIDIAKDDPELLPLTALGVFGVGLQTYERKKRLIR